MIRKASVAGAFYPASAKEVEATFAYFNEILDEHFAQKIFDKNPKALMVPHAGYVYSGFSANIAYRNVFEKPLNVVIIGPSHRVAFEGMSMCSFEAYETPFGNILANQDLEALLKSEFDFTDVAVAHQEHSTEVQFPFVKYYFPNAKLLEIVYSSSPKLEGIIKYLLDLKDVLIIISSDLSHFYTQKKANALDERCIKAVENFDFEALKECEACGKAGIKALLEVSKEQGLKTQSFEYRTSGDITGDKTSVVGYYSAMVY